LDLFGQYADNFMFSTDYPHPTALVPGPASPSQLPRDHVLANFGDVPLDVARKVLWENAAGLYGLVA
jgi:predicted TIM-barrel fold metal-dependent hydrolase